MRNYYKKAVFDVFKARVDLFSDEPYLIIKEIIQDLDNIFGIYNKFSIYDTRLHLLDFGIGIKKDKTFNKFYIRFSTTIAPLGLTELQKISTLRRLLTLKLRYQITDGFTLVSYRSFINRLR